MFTRASEPAAKKLRTASGSSEGTSSSNQATELSHSKKSGSADWALSWRATFPFLQTLQTQKPHWNISALPNEGLMLIFDMLDVKSLLTVEQVCRRWKQNASKCWKIHVDKVWSGARLTEYYRNMKEGKVEHPGWRAYYIDRLREKRRNEADSDHCALIRNVRYDPECRHSHSLMVESPHARFKNFIDFRHGIHKSIYSNNMSVRDYELAKRFLLGEVVEPSKICMCRLILVMRIEFTRHPAIYKVHTATGQRLFCFTETGGVLNTDNAPDITPCRQLLLGCTGQGEPTDPGLGNTEEEALNHIVTKIRTQHDMYPNCIHRDIRSRTHSLEYKLARKYILANCFWDPNDRPVSPHLRGVVGIDRVFLPKLLTEKNQNFTSSSSKIFSSRPVQNAAVVGTASSSSSTAPGPQLRSSLSSSSIDDSTQFTSSSYSTVTNSSHGDGQEDHNQLSSTSSDDLTLTVTDDETDCYHDMKITDLVCPGRDVFAVTLLNDVVTCAHRMDFAVIEGGRPIPNSAPWRAYFGTGIDHRIWLQPSLYGGPTLAACWKRSLKRSIHDALGVLSDHEEGQQSRRRLLTVLDSSSDNSDGDTASDLDDGTTVTTFTPGASPSTNVTRAAHILTPSVTVVESNNSGNNSNSGSSSNAGEVGRRRSVAQTGNSYARRITRSNRQPTNWRARATRAPPASRGSADQPDIVAIASVASASIPLQGASMISIIGSSSSSSSSRISSNSNSNSNMRSRSQPLPTRLPISSPISSGAEDVPVFRRIPRDVRASETANEAAAATAAHERRRRSLYWRDSCVIS